MPGVSDTGSQEKLVICSLYLLAGMVLIAMCFSLMQEEVIHKVFNMEITLSLGKREQDAGVEIGKEKWESEARMNLFVYVANKIVLI